MKYARFAAIALIAAFLSSIAYSSEPEPVWLQLDRAREAYDSGEYGDALLLIQKARETKHAITSRNLAVLEKAFASAEVRKAGDDLALIKPVLANRDEKEALEILASLAKARASAGISGSARLTLDWLRRSNVFPEADFIEGLIHDAEGETSIAMRLYLKAWENREFLDIPDQRYDILYRMAESSLGIGDRDTAEKDFLQILSDDSVYGTPDVPGATLLAMKNTLVTAKDTRKFIRLYRHENDKAFRAASLLTELYLGDDGNRERALNLAILASSMSIGMIDRVLTARRLSWDGETLSSLMDAVALSKEIAAWATEGKLWSPLLSLSRSLAAEGNVEQASEILGEMANKCPDAATARKAEGIRKSLFAQY